MDKEITSLRGLLDRLSADCYRLAEAVRTKSGVDADTLTKYYVGDIENQIHRLPDLKLSDKKTAYRLLADKLPSVERDSKLDAERKNSDGLVKLAKEINHAKARI